VADAEVLLHNISDFWYFFVAFYFIFSELGRGWVFSHDAVSNVVEGQKVAVGFSGVSFVGVYFFDGVFAVTAVNGAIRQIVGIMHGSLSQRGGQDKAVIDINGGMLFKPKVGDIVFDSPVWFQVTAEFERFAIFIQFSFYGVSFVAVFFYPVKLLEN